MTAVVRTETSRAEDLAFLAALAWILVGLGFDGWAHRHRPELETFFTPWHAIFYSGFAATCAVGAWIIVRRRPHVATFRDALPPGYAPIIPALCLFAIGGIGDMIWHTVFGVETSLDALLSPTHLLMLVSMQIAAAAPLRAAWRRQGDSPTLAAIAVPVLALAFNITSVAFFFLYANGFNNWWMTWEYSPYTYEVEASLGVLSTICSTVIMLAAVMLLARRWDLPFGAATVLFSVPGMFLAGLDAFEFWWQALAPIAGGITADLVMRSGIGGDSEAQSGKRRRMWWCGGLTPLVMWSMSTLMIHLWWTVRWPPELWVGAIVMSSLTGLALAILTFPPAIPDAENP